MQIIPQIFKNTAQNSPECHLKWKIQFLQQRGLARLQTSPRLLAANQAFSLCLCFAPAELQPVLCLSNWTTFLWFSRKKFKFLNVCIIWRFAHDVFISAIWIWGTCCMVHFASCNVWHKLSCLTLWVICSLSDAFNVSNAFITASDHCGMVDQARGNRRHPPDFNHSLVLWHCWLGGRKVIRPV